MAKSTLQETNFTEAWDVLITRGTDACRFIVLVAVNIRAVIKSTIPFLLGSSSSLIHKVPVKTGERSVLCTFML